MKCALTTAQINYVLEARACRDQMAEKPGFARWRCRRKPDWILEWNPAGLPLLKYMGHVFIALGFSVGISALISLRNSWRVGIRYDQKTPLITNGIYRWSRNPYFFSYDLLILGYILLFPSPILIVLYIALVVTFHNMILEEEKYLEKAHGDAYSNYRQRTGRYLFF